jgi:hypothetical protein
VRRLYAWLAALAGGVAAYRTFRRAPAPAPAELPDAGPADAGPADERAAELKARLEAARAAADDRDAFEAGETTVDAAADPARDPEVDERRSSVHERARAAIDEMQKE